MRSKKFFNQPAPSFQTFLFRFKFPIHRDRERERERESILKRNLMLIFRANINVSEHINEKFGEYFMSYTSCEQITHSGIGCTPRPLVDALP